MLQLLINSNTSHVIVYPHCSHCPETLSDSNTSHVIVYPEGAQIITPSERYSNTSHVIVYPLNVWKGLEYRIIQIHLMLLFITNYFVRFGSQLHSNTSHVIVYHGYCKEFGFANSIQIHLMLLFICYPQDGQRIQHAFKYISCYCLSGAL